MVLYTTWPAEIFMDLIIVESPTKAKTLSRFLGKDFLVEATYGHVRDLPEKKLGVDVAHEFKPDYTQTAKQKDRIKAIADQGKKADEVYLATDPDREGEAISWHVAELLKELKIKKPIKRIVFHEITRHAIEQAMSDPGEVDLKLVEAQQARRVLDRLVGYKLSPLLWRKIRKGLSAGRVQSVAVRLVVEREREIEAFKAEEFWTVRVEVVTDKEQRFTVILVSRDGKKIKIENGEVAGQVESDLKAAQYRIEAVATREIKRTPPAPFTTSSLQQTAANRLGWSAKKTMQIAQSLYEKGYITYHRTDSNNLAVEATAAARRFVTGEYGPEYALGEARVYKTKAKSSQEAHEAIRPTDAFKRPAEAGAEINNRDEARLYELIWRRFVACQMAETREEETKVTVEAKGSSVYLLETKGLVVKFAGWTKVYERTAAGEEEEAEDEMKRLPEVVQNQHLECKEVLKEQKFTQPPARYNDASLIKALEEMGIGRPSTYAPTLSTIQDRQYVEKLEKRFSPTALGKAVNDFLVLNFPQVVDFQFTAKMEEDLDEIAEGGKPWQPTIEQFYRPFEEILDRVQETSARVKVEVETTGEKCPKCQEGEVVVRLGKFGKFLACSRYPECDFKGNYQNKVGVACPKCGGDVIQRRTRSKKSFFGCSNYPNCDFASWTKPKVEIKKDAVAAGNLP